MYRAITVLAALAVGLILMAPALKARYWLSDVVVYQIPAALLLITVPLGNIMTFGTLVERLRAAFPLLLLLVGPTIALIVEGGTETALYSFFLLTLGLGVGVAIFPWDVRGIEILLFVLAGFGALIAINTLLFFGSDAKIAEYADVRGSSYLVESFAMGVGVIAATALVLRGMSPVSLLLFSVNWLGMSVGRGRGALIFAILVSLIYLVIAMRTRLQGFGRRKKLAALVLLAAFVPALFMQMLSVSRYGEQLVALFTDVEDSEQTRVQLIRGSFNYIAESPLLGHGLGAYIDESGHYPHNIVLQWGIDSGLVGLIPLLLGFALLGAMFLRGVRSSSAANVNFLYGAAALALFALLNYLKSYDAYVSRDIYLLFGVFIGAFTAVARDHRALRGSKKLTARPKVGPGARSAPRPGRDRPVTGATSRVRGSPGRV